jgi:predicted GH43/DUF377 family glycosyl hydrolase
MLLFERAGILLQHTNLSFEQKGVMNPAVIVHNNQIHMFYRAVSAEGISTIGYCQLSAPLVISTRNHKPILIGNTAAEQKGMEDPRIVCIDDLFFLSYTAYDGITALGSLLLSQDLQNFFGKRIIVAQEKQIRQQVNNPIQLRWDKNLVFFPRRINGKIYFMHRIKPHILLTSVPEIEHINEDFWKHIGKPKVNIPLVLNARSCGAIYEGAGCPPIETLFGWLIIYHAAYQLDGQTIYKVHVALLDLNEPSLVLAELPYAVLEPLTSYERKGNVNNVVFPTASIEKDDRIYVYYGAADTCIACAYFSKSEILEELLKNPTNENYDS